jgi:hypothetical protein
VREYQISFDVDDDMMAGFSCSENKVYRVQQIVKMQQLTLMDVQKK